MGADSAPPGLASSDEYDILDTGRESNIAALSNGEDGQFSRREWGQMKVAVDADRCEGHARCWSNCPEVFILDDEARSSVVDPLVPAHLEELVAKAAATCPERAIVIS